MGTFEGFRRNVHSQNGEDGVLMELIDRLGLPSPGICVEVGASDGTLSNVLRLIEKGWRGVLIEHAEINVAALRALAQRFSAGQVKVLRRMVGYGERDGLDAVMGLTDVPREFDLLSIDIDGYDFQVWRAFTRYQPKIVIVEINSGIPLGIRQVHGEGRQGASFTSMLELGAAKGYRLACHTGNMVFVRADLLGRLGLTDEEVAQPEILFNYAGPELRGE